VHHSAAADAFLREANIAVLATVDRHGHPHATPVWYLYDGDEFVISTTRPSRKFRNITLNPAVALVVDKRTIPYYSVVVRGDASVGPELSDSELLRLAIHYYGDVVGREYAERARAENEVTLRIQPSRIVEYLGETT
jgi:PPOX class probable F420-dependent enzyme